jgi:hypothetical protein
VRNQPECNPITTQKSTTKVGNEVRLENLLEIDFTNRKVLHVEKQGRST